MCAFFQATCVTAYCSARLRKLLPLILVGVHETFKMRITRLALKFEEK